MSRLCCMILLHGTVVSSKRANVLWNVCIQLGALSKWIVTLVTFEMSRPSRMLLTVALSEDKVVLLEQLWLLHFAAHGAGASALFRLYVPTLCKIRNRTKHLKSPILGKLFVDSKNTALLLHVCLNVCEWNSARISAVYLFQLLLQHQSQKWFACQADE